MHSLRRAWVFPVAVLGLLLAAAPSSTYAASGAGGGSVIACRPQEARCQTNQQCCNHNCIWVGRENRCR